MSLNVFAYVCLCQYIIVLCKGFFLLDTAYVEDIAQNRVVVKSEATCYLVPKFHATMADNIFLAVPHAVFLGN